MSQFTLDGKQPRRICPQCGKRTLTVSVYVDNRQPVDETRFGRCERVNSCGYELYPQKEHGLERKDFVPKDPAKTIFIMPTTDQVRAVVNYDATSYLHRFIKECTTIPLTHCAKWGVFSHKYYPDKTIYLFQRIDKKIVNWKIFQYREDGHRDKNFESYSLPAPKLYFENEKEKYELKYPMCLFGEHLLGPVNDTPVMIVESEKTAFMASYFYPEYLWVSCGAANGLTVVSKHKTNVLQGRKVYWLCDADKAGRDNKSIENLKRTMTTFGVIDLFPDRNDGYDIADSILDGYLPELTFSSSSL